MSGDAPDCLKDCQAKAKEYNKTISAIIHDPFLIVEGLSQSINDAYEEKGICYVTGYAVGEAAQLIILKKAGNKLKSIKGAGNASKTVWDNIKITQTMYDGTKIPKSFELIASGEKFWVHPNGTKHMVEYITRDPISHGMPINSQTLLSSFQNSVSGAVKKGIKYDEIMNIGNWELIFSKPRGDGLLPVIKHLCTGHS